MSTRTLSVRRLSSANYNATNTKLYVASGLTQYFDAYTSNASGSSWTDLKGSNNMTLVNSPTISTGGTASSNYVTFNGTSQYASGLTSMLNRSEFSLYLWMKTTSTAVGAYYYENPCILGVNTSGYGSRDYSITLNNGYIGFISGLVSGDATNVPSTVKVNDGNWFEIAVTSSLTNGTKLFCNQSQVGSTLTATQNTDATYAPYLGAASGNATPNYAAISVAVCMIYSRELSTSELATNWNGFRGRYGR